MGILTRATKNLSRRKTRALIVIIALSLALTLLIILPPSINAREALTQQTFNDLIGADGALNATVTLSSTEIQCDYPPPYLSPTISISDVNLPQPLMNESLYNNITSIPDVTNVIPILYELPTANRSYTIYGIPLDTASLLKEPSLLPANITDGRNLRVGDSGVVVLDEETAKNFSVSVGGTVTISGLNFTVVGIEGSELPQGTHGATMSLSDAQAVTNATDEASSYNVFVDNIDNVNTVAARISSLDPNLQVTDGLSQLNTAEPLQNQMAELIQAAQNNLNQIQGTGIVEIGIAVIADAAIILFIMLFSVRERTKEIGTLKAMGASDSAILAQFILEGIVLSLIAAIVAIAIGVFAIPTLSSLLLPTPVQVGATPETLPNGTMILTRITSGPRPFLGNGSNIIAAPITPEIMLLGLGTAVLLGALGSLYPALKAARTRPAEAMRYE
jgi:ABC-type antimicrobial peptide transport system permease subunit